MSQTREPFVVTRAARAVLGLTIAAALGAAVAASPVRFAPTSQSSIVTPAKTVQTAFSPLGDGPAISVRKSFGQHDEDCVTVTQIKGPDGRIYASRGMVCAQ